MNEKNGKEENPYYLFPSSLYVSTDGTWIQTLLGSCVAVCMIDLKEKVCGMNHYMIPFWNGSGLASPKFGNIAIEMLYEKMLEKGAIPKNMSAKIFGGANQFGATAVIGVGERNIQVAEEFLKKLRIPLMSSSTGGLKGRKIILNAATGEVMMKYIVS